MSAVAEFTIGSEVDGSDRPVGRLARILVDPIARTLTHLVVEPWHGGGAPRLVPIALVDASRDGTGIRLLCALADFDKLEAAEEKGLPSGR